MFGKTFFCRLAPALANENEGRDEYTCCEEMYGDRGPHLVEPAACEKVTPKIGLKVAHRGDTMGSRDTLLK